MPLIAISKKFKMVLTISYRNEIKWHNYMIISNKLY